MQRWKMCVMVLLAVGAAALPATAVSHPQSGATPKARASAACGSYRGLFYYISTTNMSCAAARSALNGNRGCANAQCTHLNVGGFRCQNASRVWCVRGAQRFSYTPRD